MSYANPAEGEKVNPMRNYLCLITPNYPENYLIGVQAQLWGVEEKYEHKIKQTQKIKQP